MGDGASHVRSDVVGVWAMRRGLLMAGGTVARGRSMPGGSRWISIFVSARASSAMLMGYVCALMLVLRIGQDFSLSVDAVVVDAVWRGRDRGGCGRRRWDGTRTMGSMMMTRASGLRATQELTV